MRAEPGVPDAVGIADGIRSRRIRALEVMSATLDAIARRNPELNAFVFVAESAALLASAEQIDLRVGIGEDPGPFAGVPVGIKDLEDAAGMPTTSGSLSSGDEPAAADSRLVARLRAAGAIPVGKTNTPEFGYSIDTHNRRFGPTRNPWDPTRSPGGSSGGSAAAVAAGMVPLATGSDGGGSIRIPAAFCRLPGLKPTAGWLVDEQDSWDGLTAPGALTRSVRDVARFLDVVAERPPERAFEASLSEPVKMQALRAVASVDLHGATIEHVVAGAFRAAVGRLEAAGLDVERCAAPLPDSRETFSVIAAYGDAQRLRALSEEERSKLSRGYLAWCERGAAFTPRDLAAANADRMRLAAVVDDLFAGADLILSPVVGILPWRLEDRSLLDPMDVMLTHPFNLTGQPAISMPLPGMLAGLQAVGPLGSESQLLRFAKTALEILGEGKESDG
jgi:aspartyl-tRNA(Asn)/glutamyl-tRNA(Gln) amidotransferase subunit A